MPTDGDDLAARDRLPLYPAGSTVGTPETASWVLGVGATIVSAFFVLAVATTSSELLVAVLAGVPLAWVVKRAYQRLPAAQSVTAVVDPQGIVRVAFGRGALRPVADTLNRGAELTGAGQVVGLLLGALGPVLLAVLAVSLDAPWLAGVLLPVIPALLIELTFRMALTNRRLTRGWRLGRPDLGGWVAIWGLEHDTARSGVGAAALLSTVDRHPALRQRATRLVREALTVTLP